MTWSTSIADFRNLLSDGTNDKLRYRKPVIGSPNGTLLAFKTFEFRRLTDFTAASPPPNLGVFVNGASVAVTSDDLTSGEFILTTAPIDGDVVEATYYIQWFLDAELAIFLKSSSQWLLMGPDETVVPDGLQPAALAFAAHVAYQKLALRWAEHMSEVYRTEDAPDKNRMQLVDEYWKMSMGYEKEAKDLRDGYYGRSGQSLSPLFRSSSGRVREIPPPR